MLSPLTAQHPESHDNAGGPGVLPAETADRPDTAIVPAGCGHTIADHTGDGCRVCQCTHPEDDFVTEHCGVD